MKMHCVKNILLALSLSISLLLSPYVQAQAQNQDSSVPAPTSSLNVFPKLPQSSLCKKEKLVGTWKLIMVYEVPSGKEIELYTNSPLQYYVFEGDNRYGEYVSMLQAITMKEIRDTIIVKQKKLQQFSINKDGFLFFYTDAVATDSLACFMVEKGAPPFRAGQLLLMPPEKAARGRLVKVYQKMFPELEALPAVIPKDTESTEEQ